MLGRGRRPDLWVVPHVLVTRGLPLVLLLVHLVMLEHTLCPRAPALLVHV